MTSSKNPVLTCFRCQTDRLHSACGTAYEDNYIEVGEGEIEAGIPNVTSLLKCVNCGLISLWIMKPLPPLPPEKVTSTSVDNVAVPVYCIFRELNVQAPFDFLKLSIAPDLAKSLKMRWRDVQSCLSVGAWLGAVILMGSILEGMLLAVIERNMQAANTSPHAPKKAKPISDWGLEAMIEVAHGEGWINKDIREYSKTLRQFRNFVHPHLHADQNDGLIEITEGTCMISWHVLQAAINQLSWRCL